jgi:hypothetical protein
VCPGVGPVVAFLPQDFAALQAQVGMLALQITELRPQFAGFANRSMTSPLLPNDEMQPAQAVPGTPTQRATLPQGAPACGQESK